MKKLLTVSLSVFLAIAVAGTSLAESKAFARKGHAKYALCVGINHYSSAYGAESLKGCVNDAMVFRASLTTLGGWSTANVSVLTDSLATKGAIRSAIAEIAAKTTSGDTFVYQHSSHGKQFADTSVCICAHDANYADEELAEDLAAFPSGVKVVVIVDACHSGGLFKGRKNADGIKFDLAQRVTSIMDAKRARRLFKGEKGADKNLASSEIGWVTATEFYESSIDYGFYDTDSWLTDPDAAGKIRSGTFMGAFIWSWWSGAADIGAAGDGDDCFDPYEGYSVAQAFCKKLNAFWDEEDVSFNPQFLNESVLRSVELGVCAPIDITTAFKPSNDDFADACLIFDESGTTNSSTIVATRENGEPEHADCTTGSVWWRWTAPADGCVAFNTDGSDFDTVMAVYSGASLESLVELHSNDDYEASVGNSSRCVFEAAAGTAYSIAVAGYSGCGNVVLNWEYFLPTPLAMAPTNVSALIEYDGEHWECRLSASGGTGNYSWSLADGTELPSGLRLYADGWLWGNLSTNDFGEYSLGVVVTDAFGTNATATVALTVAADPNHRPVIDSYSPEADAIVVRPGESVRFSVEAHDPDGNALTNVWSLYEVEYNEDDDYYNWQTVTNLERQADGTILFSPESLNLADGRYGIEVAVGDGARTTYNRWTVIVGAPEALLVKTTSITALVEGDNGDWWHANLSANGGLSPYSWSLAEGSELPCDMLLELDGELYGWPTSSDIGTYTFDVVVTDALGTNATETITLTISEDQNHRPVIDTCSPEAEAVVVRSGETVDFSVEAHDPDGDAMTCEWSLYRVVYDEEKGYDDWTWIDNPWPQADGTIRFSQESLDLADGRYGIEVAVGDGARTSYCSWIVVIGEPEPLSVATPCVTALVEGEGGDWWSAYLSASGGVAPYSWSLAEGVELPEDLELDSDGVLYGWPTSSDIGTNEFNVVVTDAIGTEVVATLTLRIEEDANSRPVIDFYSPDAEAVVVYSGETADFSVEAHDPDGDAMTYEWLLYRAVYNDEQGDYEWEWVADLVPRADGTVLFSPEDLNLANGRYGLDVAVGDGARAAYVGWIVQVGEPEPLSVATPCVTALVEGVGGDWWNTYLSAHGGVSPYSWGLAEGAELPGDLELDSDGVLYGWPTSADIGTYTFNVVVTDALGSNVLSTVTLMVSEDSNHRPVIDTCSPDEEAVVVYSGETADFSVEAHDPDGDALTYEWSIYRIEYDDELGYDAWSWIITLEQQQGKSALFSPESLELADGRYGIEVAVGDGARTAYTSWIAVVGEPEAPVLETTNIIALVDGTEGDWICAYLSANGGVAPYSWSLAEGAELPGDLELDSDGILYGWSTSADIGTYTFNVIVVDTLGTKATALITVSISEDPNHRPVINAHSSDSVEFCEMRIDQTQVFSVSASDPDGDDIAVSWMLYEIVPVEYDDAGFLINGPYNLICELYPLANGTVAFSPSALGLTGGQYNIEATISDGLRAVCQNWYFDIIEPGTIFFDANGGTGFMTPIKMFAGDMVTLPINTFKHNGRTFMGWARSANGSVAYADKASVKNLVEANGSVTLYAQWAVSKYKVRFFANGGKLPKGKKMTAQTMTYGKAAKLRKNVFTRKGWVFAGWTKSKNGAVEYKNAQSVKNLTAKGGTVTLYAKWAKKTYKVAFYANGGKLPKGKKMPVQKMTYGKAKKLTANKFKRKGYVFKGWAKSKALAKKGKVAYKNKKKVKNLVTNGKTVKLYAVWKKK